MAALIGMVSISAARVGALLHAFSAVFDALPELGAADWADLGYQLWAAAVAPGDGAQTACVDPIARSSGSYFRQGLAVAASHPKAIVFSAACFPQLSQSDRPAGLQFAMLLLTITVIEGGYLVYAMSGHKLSRVLQQSRLLKNSNRVKGGVFMGFAALMAASR